MQNFNILSALSLNQHFQDNTSPFLPFVTMIDKLNSNPVVEPSFDQLLANLEQFNEGLDQLTNHFTGVSPLNFVVLNQAWGGLLKGCMKSFIKADHLNYDAPLIEQLESLVDNAKFERGLVMLDLKNERIEIPSMSAMRNIDCNGLELSLFLNTGALEIVVNSLYHVISENTEQFVFGIDMQKHPEAIVFLEEFGRYQLDVVYDLKWGTAEERKSSEAYKQRNEAINTSNLFSLCG